jgi:NADH-quinone oxidoreductase subunit G
MRLQSAVTMNSGMASECKLLGSEQVQVKQGKGTAVLPLRVDDGVADGCVYVPVGIAAVSHLGGAYGIVSLEKLS